MAKTSDDQLSEKDIQQRMEAAIRRAQKTPHKPHAKQKPSPKKRKAKKR